MLKTKKMPGGETGHRTNHHEEGSMNTLYDNNFVRSLYVSGNIIILRRNSGDYRGVDCSHGMLSDRGTIGGFSMSSGRRMRKFLRESRAEYKSMLTLTYPDGFGIDGRKSKNDLKRFCQWLESWADDNLNDYGRSRFSIFWFLEFTESGRIHYHLLCTDYIDYRDIAFAWASIVSKGTDQFDKHLKAGTRIEKIQTGRSGIISYAAKYAAKQSQKVVPDGFGWVGRFWGYRGYSERVSASTRLKTADFQHFSVSKLVKTVENYIKNSVSARICKKVELKEEHLNEFIEIYAFDSISQGQKVEKMVNFIEFLRCFHSPEDEYVGMSEEKIQFCYEELLRGNDELDKTVIELCRSFA